MKNKILIPVSYGMKIPFNFIDLGMCITSRYYKGFSNYNPENAVIEVKKIDKDQVQLWIKK